MKKICLKLSIFIITVNCEKNKWINFKKILSYKNFHIFLDRRCGFYVAMPCLRRET